MAKFGQLPEVVKYIEFGKEHFALPVGSRILDHHTGENDEPLLDLFIVQPVIPDICANCGNREQFHGKPAPAALRVCKEFVAPDPIAATNPMDYVKFHGDVPHVSHQFTEEQLETLHKSGVTISVAYPGGKVPGGRWRELSAEELMAFPKMPVEPEEPLAKPPEAPTVQ